MDFSLIILCYVFDIYNNYILAMKQIHFQRGSFSRTPNKFISNHLSLKYISLQDKKTEIELQSKIISIPQNQLQEQQKVYLWRQKTQFPIVKVNKFQTKLHKGRNTIVQVTVETYPIRVFQVKDLPLFKILYLLKEVLIGFQRLFYRFGSFMITAKMIALDQMNRCKVWLNEDFTKNSFKNSNLDEKYFLMSIFQILQGRVNKSKNNIKFFNQLYFCYNFISALAYIQNYAKENRITLSTFCKIVHKEKIQNSKPQIISPALSVNSIKVQKKSSQEIEHQVMFRMSFNPSFNLPVIISKDFSCKENQLKAQQIKQNTKSASDVTAAQTPNKISQNDKYYKNPWIHDIQNVLFANQFDEPQNLVAKSFFFQQKPSVKQNAGRKFSEQHPQIKSFGSQKNVAEKGRIKQKEQRKQLKFGQWQSNQFSFQTNSQTNAIDILNQNRWTVIVQDLFDEKSQVKKSMHEGKQIRKESSSDRFQLLDQIHKQMNESYCEQDQIHQHREPY